MPFDGRKLPEDGYGQDMRKDSLFMRSLHSEVRIWNLYGAHIFGRFAFFESNRPADVTDNSDE